MKKIDKIPTSKLQRVAKIVGTTVKVGGNYLKYYGESIVNPKEAKDHLHENNAETIYEGLTELRGSALKVAQMMSMDKNILPQQYVEKFSLSQFSVPPISAALVRKTFKSNFNKAPEELFESFSPDALHAASIGQVHMATLKGQKLAVKVQYPGVRDSIKSDLAMIKPIAMKVFQMNTASDDYFEEVEEKLLEETDYLLEMKQGEQMRIDCANLKNVRLPKYLSEFTTQKIITMEWLEGIHFSEFSRQETDIDKKTKVGQALWDFYMHQLHNLKRFHADPHPGNFLINEEGELLVLDFGCLKTIPEDFYQDFVTITEKETLADSEIFKAQLLKMDILHQDDSVEDMVFLTDLFHEIITIFTTPIHSDSFDFAQEDFFARIAQLSEKISKDKRIRKLGANRGSKHFIYLNRTFFGLYSMLFDLKVKVKIYNH